MEEQNNNSQKSNFRDYLVLYLDITIRGLIAFLCIGLVLGGILIGYFKVSYIWVLPISFILSIFTSPLLMKVRLGEYALFHFEKFLDKMMYKFMGNKEK